MNNQPDLPANIELEPSVLAAILIDNGIIDLIADTLSAYDFSLGIHRRIFEAACHQHATTGVANPPTLAPLFKDDEDIKELGGPSYLAKLTASTAGQLDPKGFARQLAAIGRRRRVVEGLTAATAAARDQNVKISDAIGIADEAIGEKAISTIRESDASDCFDEMFEGYKTEDRGVTCTVIPTLDHLMGSLKPGSLNIMAGRPGMGKSAVSFSYARGAAENGHGTLLVSLEMPGDQIAQRMAADLCYDEHQIEYRNIRDGRLDADETALVRAAQGRVRQMPLRIACGSALPVGRLASLIRRTKRRFAAHGATLDLVVIDYLQLLRPDQRGNRYEAITEISMALKAMALDNDVAILALAQLSRQVEQRDDKRPMLSDLRESGQLEQDADSVTFLLRQQYYLQKEEPPRSNDKYVEWQSKLAEVRDKIEFIVAKRRNGTEGSGLASFFGKYQAVRG